MVDKETLEERYEEHPPIGPRRKPSLHSNAPKIKPASYVDENFLEERGDERGRRLTPEKFYSKSPEPTEEEKLISSTNEAVEAYLKIMERYDIKIDTPRYGLVKTQFLSTLEIKEKQSKERTK